MTSTDLPTVDEADAINEQPQDQAVVDEEAEFDDDDMAARLHFRRQSYASGFSGTTAKTSFSQEEIADLDADMMVDLLPNVASAADRVSEFLLPADEKAGPVIWKEVRTVGSRHSKFFSNRLAAFELHKHDFGSQIYIEPSIVLRVVLGVTNVQDVPAGKWRPDSIIHKINLAQMLRSTLVTLFDPVEITQEGYDALATLNTDFARTIAGSEFDMQAFNMALAIQTRLTLASLVNYRHQPGFSARSVITDIFFEGADSDESVYKHANALHFQDASDADRANCTNALTQAADELLAMFDGRNAMTIDAAIRTLANKYPWDSFQDQVVHYYNHRRGRLNEQIAAAGGVEQIMQGLSEEVQRRAEAKIADQKRMSVGEAKATPKKGFGLGGIAALKAREKRLTQASAASPLTAQVAPVAQMAATAPVVVQQQQQQQETGVVEDNGWMRPNDEDADQQPQPQPEPTPQQKATSALEQATGYDLGGFMSKARPGARKGKARSFIDPQPNAQRVEFDETQPSQATGVNYEVPGSSAQRPYHVSPRRSQAKRTHEEMEEELNEFDPSQDNGFQTADFDRAAADERRRQAPAATAPRARFSSAGPSTYPPAPTATSSSPKRQRKNPGSALPPSTERLGEEGGLPPRSTYYAQAKEQAKLARITASQSRPPQVRTPWTDDEEMALIELIEEHGGEGVSYAVLKKWDEDKKADAQLHRRRAEDIRFKARGMKEVMLL